MNNKLAFPKNKALSVTIVIPAFKPDKKILEKITRSLKSQKYEGTFEVIFVDKGLGLSKQINWAISRSRSEVVVVLLQDCVPKGPFWLRNLLSPLSNPNVVASVSKVTLPDKIWNNSSSFTKSLIAKERGTITPLLDGKGTAYRRTSLNKVKLFDEDTFRTAGEDFDMYTKLRKMGVIAYPSAEVIHYHPTTTYQRLRKIRQYAQGYGTLVRVYGTSMLKWYASLILATPLLGLMALIINYPYRNVPKYGLHFLLISPAVHIQYIRGFWSGFLRGRQTL